MDIKKISLVPRSLVYDLIFFGLEGLRLPVLFSNRIKITGARKGAIILEDKKRRIFFGYNGTSGIPCNPHGHLSIGENGYIRFKGSAMFAKGIYLQVNSGEIVFGDKFICNRNGFIICDQKIEFGEQVLLGWNVFIRDGDGHPILDRDGKRTNPDLPIRIGKHVWLCSHSAVMKGAEIKDGCVAAYQACVTKSTKTEPDCILAGSPAKIVKRDIHWQL